MRILAGLLSRGRDRGGRRRRRATPARRAAALRRAARTACAAGSAGCCRCRCWCARPSRRSNGIRPAATEGFSIRRDALETARAALCGAPSAPCARRPPHARRALSRRRSPSCTRCRATRWRRPGAPITITPCARTVPCCWRRSAEASPWSRKTPPPARRSSSTTTRPQQRSTAKADRTLRILEQELGIDARARGNEVRLVGAAAEVGVARKVLEELYGTLRGGDAVHARDVRAALRIATQAARRRARRRLRGRARRRRIAPAHHREEPGAAPLHRADAQARRGVRDRPGGHRQDVSRDGAGDRGAESPRSLARRADAPRGRSRREARLPARHDGREGESLPAPALRRAPRHDADARRRGA